MRSIMFCLAMCAIVTRASADDGRLPRGTMKSNPKLIPPQTSGNFGSKNCSEYNASPIFGTAYLSPSKEHLYVLVKNPHLKNGRVIFDSAKNYNYDFYRLNLQSFSWDILMSFKKGDISVAVPHDKYTDGISFLTFSEFQDGCFFGNGGGFSANLSENGRTASGKQFSYGRYKVLPSSSARSVADMSKYSIIETDPKLFQRRIALKFDKNHIPVYLDYQSRKLVTYNQNTQPHQLEVKLESSKEPYKKMPLEINQKFLREDNRFAKMYYENKGTRVIIQTSQEWTATKENLYKLNLPAAFAADDISIYPRFINNTAVILGINKQERKRIREAIVYDLTRDRVIHRHSPRAGLYVSFATMGPSGKFAYFVVSYIKTGAFFRLFRYDLNKKYYRVLKPMMRVEGSKGSVKKN